MMDDFPQNQILHRSKTWKTQTHNNLILGQESLPSIQTDTPTKQVKHKPGIMAITDRN